MTREHDLGIGPIKSGVEEDDAIIFMLHVVLKFGLTIIFGYDGCSS